MSQKLTIDSGVKPRRRMPDMVSMRGSSQPSTMASLTSWLSLRLLVSEVLELQARELGLLGPRRRFEVVENPVVERAVILEFERAQRVGHALDRIRQSVGEIVQRVDAPVVAGIVMGDVADAVQHRVAQVDVGRGHVDLGAQHVFAVGILVVFMSSNSCRFSSTLRSRYGLSTPGSVRVPRLARISSALWLST